MGFIGYITVLTFLVLLKLHSIHKTLLVQHETMKSIRNRIEPRSTFARVNLRSIEEISE